MTESMPEYIFAFDGKSLRRFYLDDPTFNIEEMAWGMSMQCRFSGHIKRFYSVAEHSLLVSRLAKHLGADPFEGLMHDAHEGYITDIASPVKRGLPDYKALENRVELALRKHYGINPDMDPLVKHADRLALYIETIWLMPPGALHGMIHGDELAKEEAMQLHQEYEPIGMRPENARAVFLRKYHQLMGSRPRRF